MEILFLHQFYLIMLPSVNIVNRNNVGFQRSQKPFRPDIKVGIVDHFDNKVIDINGDRCVDLSHGESVRYLLEGLLNFKPKIQIFNIDEDPDEDLPGKKLTDLEKILFQLSKAEKTSIPYLNMSIGNTVYEDISSISIRDLSPEQKNIIEKLKTLLKNGKRIFLAASNDYNGGFSSFALIKDERLACVASLDRNGEYSEFSNVNEYVTHDTLGEYDIMPVIDPKTWSVEGYDLTGDGITDIPITAITGYETINYFVGRRKADVVAQEEDYKSIRYYIREYEMLGGDLEHFIQDNNIDQELGDKLFHLKEVPHGLEYEDLPEWENIYVDIYTLLNMNDSNMFSSKKNPLLYFRFKDNKVVYNPYGQPGGPIGVLTGTSYATSTAHAEFLNQEERLVTA